jgi:processing peptidase subunit alpha
LQGATATIGIFINSGSVYESQWSTGASHLLEYMAFKTTRNRTHLRLVREAEAIGANLLASASREQMVYNIDTSKATVPEALELLADAVLNPKFQSWEVAEQVARMREDVKNAAANPQTLLSEVMHAAAYSGALAQPLIAPEGVLPALNADALAEFYSQNYVAPRMVLAAAGVEHGELLRLAEPLLGAVTSGAGAEEPLSAYTGGDWRQYAAAPLTHATLAFEAPGGWRDVKGACVATVLQYLLGGGGSFSTGGPGKGMHSRLYKRVLNRHAWVHNCTAVNSLYNDTGLVGIFASAEAAHAGELVPLMVREFQAVTKEVPVEELERAKAAAAASVVMNLESRAVTAEDIGRQVLTYGHRVPVPEFLAVIRALTPADVAKAVRALLKKPPTLAVVGDVAAVQRYDEVAKALA